MFCIFRLQVTMDNLRHFKFVGQYAALHAELLVEPYRVITHE